MVVLLATAIALGLLGTYRVWYYYQTIEIGYRLDKEIDNRRRLLERQRKLTLQLHSERDEAFEKYRFRSDLELRFPGAGELVIVEEAPDVPNE